MPTNPAITLLGNCNVSSSADFSTRKKISAWGDYKLRSPQKIFWGDFWISIPKKYRSQMRRSPSVMCLTKSLKNGLFWCTASILNTIMSPPKERYWNIGWCHFLGRPIFAVFPSSILGIPLFLVFPSQFFLTRTEIGNFRIDTKISKTQNIVSIPSLA